MLTMSGINRAPKNRAPPPSVLRKKHMRKLASEQAVHFEKDVVEDEEADEYYEDGELTRS